MPTIVVKNGAKDAAEEKPGAGPAVLHVAVGCIVRDGQVLLARRAPEKHQGGLWEFPGGKVETGETVEAALERELAEELGIRVLCRQPLGRVRHAYEALHVLLDVFLVEDFEGEVSGPGIADGPTSGQGSDKAQGQIYGEEGQPLRWVPIHDLDPAEFPTANRAIIRMLELTERIAITGGADSPEDFLGRVAGLINQGLELIQLRPFRTAEGLALDPEDWLSHYLQPAVNLCRRQGVRTLVNGPLSWLQQVDADGYHASSDRLMVLEQRPVAGRHLFSASCHSLDQLQRAERLGADFALLSPVKETRSHPGRSALGWTAFSELSRQVDLPVYALGGLADADLARAGRAGARGIAAIGAFWPAADQSSLSS